MVILDTIDGVIFRVCPFIAAGIVVGSIYWTAVTYGAVTVMQVVGHKDGLAMMEQADPLILLVGLPTIPIMLVLGKMLRWEDQALSLLRRHASKVPILRHFLPRRYPLFFVFFSRPSPPLFCLIFILGLTQKSRAFRTSFSAIPTTMTTTTMATTAAAAVAAVAAAAAATTEHNLKTFHR